MLKKHIDAVHKKLSPYPYPCEICNKPFKTEGKLKRHVASIHKKSKPYECGS